MAVIEKYTKTEQKEIRAAFDYLMSTLEGNMTEEDVIHLWKAYELAYDAHSDQRRKSGEPYIFHPLEVARICIEEMGLGPTAIIAAILHDVVEDRSEERRVGYGCR